jgi:hypothetical protein
MLTVNSFEVDDLVLGRGGIPVGQDGPALVFLQLLDYGFLLVRKVGIVQEEQIDRGLELESTDLAQDYHIH